MHRPLRAGFIALLLAVTCATAPRCDIVPVDHTNPCAACGAAEFCSAGTCVADHAGPGPHIERRALVPGEVSALATNAHQVLVVSGTLLFVFEKTAGGALTERGRLELAGPIHGVAADERFAYLAVGGALATVDIRSTPTLVAERTEPGRGLGRPALADGKLYARSDTDAPPWEARLHVFAVKPLGALVPLRTYTPEDFGRELYGAFAVRGDLLALGYPPGVGLYRLGPDPPELLSAVEFPWPSRDYGAQQIEFGDAGRLYAACLADLLAYDVSDPYAPVLLGHTHPSSDSVVDPHDAAYFGGHFYATGREDSLVGFDVTGPAQPRRQSALEPGFESVDGTWPVTDDVCADADGVWLNATAHGLFRLPLLPPYEEGAAPAPWPRERVWAGAGDPVGAARVGDRLVFAGAPSLATFWDVGALWGAGSDPVTPRYVSALRGEQETLWAGPTALANDRLYAVVGLPGPQSALRIYDLSAGGSSPPIGSVALPLALGATTPDHRALAVGNTVVAAVWRSSAVDLVDITDETVPRYAARVELESYYLKHIVMSGDGVYAAADNRLHAIDASLADAPVEGTPLSLDDPITAVVALAGRDQLLVATKAPALVLVDVGDPLQPVLADWSLPLPAERGPFAWLAAAWPYAYVRTQRDWSQPTTGPQALHVVDLRGEGRILATHELDTFELYGELAVIDRHLVSLDSTAPVVLGPAAP